MSYSPFKFNSQTYLDSFVVLLDLSMYLMKVLKAANCAMILEFPYFPCNCSLNFRVIFGEVFFKSSKSFYVYSYVYRISRIKPNNIAFSLLFLTVLICWK